MTTFFTCNLLKVTQSSVVLSGKNLHILKSPAEIDFFYVNQYLLSLATAVKTPCLPLSARTPPSARSRVGLPAATRPDEDVILGSGGLVSLPHRLHQLGEEGAEAGSERDELVDEGEGALTLLPLWEHGQDVAGHGAVVEAEVEVAGRHGEALRQNGGVVRALEGDLSAGPIAGSYPEPGALLADPDHLPVTNTAPHTPGRHQDLGPHALAALWGQEGVGEGRHGAGGS